MATFTINSRKYGEQVFFVPSDINDSSSYVKQLTGVLGYHKQICAGGSPMGETITCRPSNLERVARRWWSQFLRMERS